MSTRARIVVSSLLALATAGCRNAPPQIADANANANADVTATAAAPAASPAVDAGREDSAVGIARIRADGTIELDMFTPHARLTYAPDHPQYLEIRHHIEATGGLLVPGQERPIPPFPTPAVPASSVRMSGTVARELIREMASWPVGDARRGQDVFVAPNGATPRIVTLDRIATAPGGPGLRVPAIVTAVLATTASVVASENAKLENYDVFARLEGDTLSVILEPHLAPGERYHPGGGTSLGRELHLAFDPRSGALIKKTYAR